MDNWRGKLGKIASKGGRKKMVNMLIPSGQGIRTRGQNGKTVKRAETGRWEKRES